MPQFTDNQHSFAVPTHASASSVSSSFQPINDKDLVSVGLVSSSVSMSHTVDKVTIPGNTAVWYRKEISSPAKARREWLAQEFLRLVIPNQTETRLAHNSNTNVYYILSREVPGFKPLPKNECEKFNNGTYKGLGRVITGAYFVHEADLKNGNIGLGEDNVVYKIDGDWSFASMRSEGQFPQVSGAIAAVQINRLPFPLTYKAYNWLDLFIEGSLASESDIVSSDIANSNHFQQEKFDTLFKLLLIPDSYFRKFVDAFIPAGAKEYSDFFIARRNTLLKQAQRIHGFGEYLAVNQNQLVDWADAFQSDMSKFKMHGQYAVIPEEGKMNLSEQCKAQLQGLVAHFHLSPATSAASSASTSIVPSFALSRAPTSIDDAKSSEKPSPRRRFENVKPSSYGLFSKAIHQPQEEGKEEAKSTVGPNGH